MWHTYLYLNSWEWSLYSYSVLQNISYFKLSIYLDAKFDFCTYGSPFPLKKKKFNVCILLTKVVIFVLVLITNEINTLCILMRPQNYQEVYWLQYLPSIYIQILFIPYTTLLQSQWHRGWCNSTRLIPTPHPL